MVHYRGGIAAWVGFTLPPAMAMIAFGLFASNADLADAGWVHGLQVAAVAVVAQAVFGMARTLTPDAPRLILAAVAAAIALALPTPWIQLALIIGGAGIGGLLFRVARHRSWSSPHVPPSARSPLASPDLAPPAESRSAARRPDSTATRDVVGGTARRHTE